MALLDGLAGPGGPELVLNSSSAVGTTVYLMTGLMGVPAVMAHLVSRVGIVPEALVNMTGQAATGAGTAA